MLLLCTRNILQIMKVFEKNADLQNALFAARKQGQSVGFVPTMGALHEGHASLIKRSAKENDVTVVSVFLNPTQFNDPADLERYPRHTEGRLRPLRGLWRRLRLRAYRERHLPHSRYPPL